MSAGSILNMGISGSVSLDPTLQIENIEPKKNYNRKRIITISFFAFIISVLAGIVAKLLVYLIFLVTNISYYGKVSIEYLSPAGNTLGLIAIIIPVIGGIIVGLMAYFGSKAIRGHGIPEAMEQILTNQSRIKPFITFLKPFSSAIAIGTGGPFGAEGPIIATGGALGSTFGQLTKISSNERKILLTAGATAGMAAIFGCPVAAIFLAIELLLFEFSPRSLIPVAIAGITGATAHHFLFGTAPFFNIAQVAAPNNIAIFWYSILGIGIGFISVLASKTIYFLEDSFEKIPVHWMWWPAIGGLAVGIVGYFAPNTLGVGYENITRMLTLTNSIYILLSLFLLKFVSWAIALSSGTSGGTLAPLFTIGGAAGALAGGVILHYFPQSGITIPLSALIGMSAMFTGASRALLTSIIFAVETTSQSNAILPLVSSCLAAYMISFLLMENTIMTEKIARRGIPTPDSLEPDILEKLSVERVLKENATVFSEDNTIQELRDWLAKEPDYSANYFIITTNEGEFKGVISSSNIMSHHHKTDEKIGMLVKRKSSFIGTHNTLRTAVEMMAKENVDILPVVSKDHNKNIIGLLSYQDILSAYRFRSEEHEKKQPDISIKRRTMKILVRGQKLFTLHKKKE